MSAVLVKMPPPALANRASELAPKEKAMTISGSFVNSQTMAAPARDVPTTAMPITAPPRKPAMKDFWMDSCAAVAARTLDSVAMEMPT